MRQEVDKSIVSALSAIAVSQQTRLSVVLLSMWQLVVAHLSGARDVVVGSPYSGRDHPAFQDVIGCVQTLMPLSSVVRCVSLGWG